MSKRVAKVKFLGEFPFVIPYVTYDDGESEFLVGGREKMLVSDETERSSEVPSPSARPPSLKFPQLNLNPLTAYLEQVSQNMTSALQQMMPKQESVYAHKETKVEYIRRMQEQKKLYPNCPDSSFLVTKCSICDRKELCDVLREEERRRQEEFDKMYGSR